MASRQRVAYREVTPWPWWVILLIWGSGLGGGFALVSAASRSLGRLGGAGSDPHKALILFMVAGLVILLPVVFQLLMGALVVELTAETITVRFGRLGFPSKRISFDEVVAIESVTYSPIREFGGWGIRFGTGGKSAWTTRGDRALKIELESGKSVYVGSDNPERLRSRIATTVGRRYEWSS